MRNKRFKPIFGDNCRPVLLGALLTLFASIFVKIINIFKLNDEIQLYVLVTTVFVVFILFLAAGDEEDE